MIHALGLSPSLDVVYTVPALTTGEIHRPTSVVRLAGGKSLNVARALVRLGRPVRAIAPLGDHLGDLVAELLAPSGVELVRISSTSTTRMCVTVADERAGTLTELYEHAPPADPDELAAVADALDAVAAGDWLVLSGNVPVGIDLDDLVALLVRLRSRGARLAVDTHGPALARVVAEVGPDVLKINRAEAAELVAADPAAAPSGVDLAELGAAVRALGVDLLVLTDGAAGALGWDADRVWRVRTDAEPGAYPVGSGDCFLAGLVADLSTGRPLPEALATAAAVGAANAAIPGGALFEDATLARLRDRTAVVPVG